MATALDIIKDALKEIHVLAEGDTPTNEMAQDALRALNRIFEKYSNEQSFSNYANSFSRTLAGETSFTVGPTGDEVRARPIRIESATVTRDGITYPVGVIDNQKYDSIIYKAAAGANTTAVYYEPQYPNGIVYLWPIATGCTLNLRVTNLLTSFPDLTTSVSLPPGYEELMVKNLAVTIAPQYPAGTLSPLTIQQAAAARKYISRTNNVIPTMTIDNNLTNRHGGSLAAFLGGY